MGSVHEPMDKKILAKLEAVLYIYGEPLEAKKLAKILPRLREASRIS